MHDEERQDLPSASASARLAKCPGSHKRSIGKQGIQTREMRAWRDEGNRIHDWLCNNLGPRLALNDGVFKSMDRALSESEQDVADRCVDQARELVGRIFDSSARLLQEHRMWLYHSVPSTYDSESPEAYLVKRFSGKADAVFIYRDVATGLYKCLILDFKTNRGDVEDTPRNQQLRDLAVLLWLSLGGKVSSINVAIIQPLIHPQVQDPCCYGVPELHIAHNMLLHRLAESELPDPPLNPGHEQCKFCPAKFDCPALIALRDSLNPDITGATAAQLAEWLDRAEPIVRAYDEAKAGVREHLALDPASVPGWELRDSNGDRFIQDPLGAHDALTQASLIDTPTFLQKAASVGIGALKDALVAYNQLKPKTKADHIINTVCAPFLTRTLKQPALVRK